MILRGRFWWLGFGAILLQARCTAANSDYAQPRENNMDADPAQVLQSSEDSAELVVVAVTLARSAEPRDHETLLKSLQSTVFLGRLDSEEDYQRPRRMLRIASVLDALAKNKASSAREVLVSLTQNPPFLDFPSRTELLIEASVVIRPATPETVKFWEKHFDPEDIYVTLLVEALLENGTTPALELFEKKMADPAFEDERKVYWMRVKVLPHRNDTPVLRSCERLLADGLPENLRPNLVEVLFDWQETWYRPSNLITCPNPAGLGASGRAQLRRIGQYALKNVKLSNEQRQAVENTLEQLDRKTVSPGDSGP